MNVGAIEERVRLAGVAHTAPHGPSSTSACRRRRRWRWRACRCSSSSASSASGSPITGSRGRGGVRDGAGAEIAEDHPLVGALDEAHAAVFGAAPERDVTRWFSDVEVLTRYGIATVNYGASTGLLDTVKGENLDRGAREDGPGLRSSGDERVRRRMRRARCRTTRRRPRLSTGWSTAFCRRTWAAVAAAAGRRRVRELARAGRGDDATSAVTRSDRGSPGASRRSRVASTATRALRLGQSRVLGMDAAGDDRGGRGHRGARLRHLDVCGRPDRAEELVLEDRAMKLVTFDEGAGRVGTLEGDEIAVLDAPTCATTSSGAAPRPAAGRARERTRARRSSRRSSSTPPATSGSTRRSRSRSAGRTRSLPGSCSSRTWTRSWGRTSRWCTPST